MSSSPVENWKTTTLGAIAKKHGYCDAKSLRCLFTIDDIADMEKLGYNKNRYNLHPAVVKYIEEVFFKRQNKFELFPILKEK